MSGGSPVNPMENLSFFTHIDFAIFVRLTRTPVADQLRIIQSSNPKKKFVQYVIDELTAFDNSHLPAGVSTSRTPIKLFLVDENNRICGGLFGDIYWNALQVFTLWVHEEHRGKGKGRALLDEAEKVARDKGCTLMMVETTSFNGPDFYLKFGFEITGTVENFPEGCTFYYFNKKLV